MNKQEQRRLLVLNQMEKGQIIRRETDETLALSLRHVRRLVAAYRKEGVAALAHGNRGRKSPNTLGETVRKQVLELIRNISSILESFYIKAGIMVPETGFLLMDLLTYLVA